MTHWNYPPTSGVLPDLPMLMGRLLERSEAVVDRLERIDQRLQAGDARMDEIAERITAIEATTACASCAMKMAERRDAMPTAERLIKMLLPYVIGLTALLATGSIEAAVKIITALSGGK